MHNAFITPEGFNGIELYTADLKAIIERFKDFYTKDEEKKLIAEFLFEINNLEKIFKLELEDYLNDMETKEKTDKIMTDKDIKNFFKQE